MKRIRLFWQFYRENWLPCAILAVVIAVALCSVSFAVGQYRFVMLAKTIFQNSGLENALFYMPNFESGENDLFSELDGLDKLPGQFRALSGVETVLTHPEESVSYLGQNGGLNLYSEAMLKAFPPDLAQGTSFSETEDPNAPPQVIVGGSSFQDVRVGSDIDLDFLFGSVDGTLGKRTLTVHVVGKLRYPGYVANFQKAGTAVSADELLRTFNGALFLDTPALRDKLAELGTYPSDNSSIFIKLREDCTPAQHNEIIEFIQKTGSYVTYDKILRNTDKYIENQLSSMFPAPLFFLFIATMALVCISTLLVQKKLNEHSIYFLCGCGRRKSFLYLLAGVGGIAVAAGLLNILLLACYPLLSWKGIMDWGTVYLDGYSGLFIVAYLLVVVPLSSVLPYLTFRSVSPIEFYRRNEQ